VLTIQPDQYTGGRLTVTREGYFPTVFPIEALCAPKVMLEPANELRVRLETAAGDASLDGYTVTLDAEDGVLSARDA